MWITWSFIGLACATFYGFGIAYSQEVFGLHPLGFVTLWMPGVIIGLMAMLWISHANGVFTLDAVQSKYWYVAVLLPVAGITIGVLMNLSIPYAIGSAPNPGFVFAIASCAAPLIAFLSVQLGVSADYELSNWNKIGLLALPLVVLLATYRS